MADGLGALVQWGQLFGKGSSSLGNFGTSIARGLGFTNEGSSAKQLDMMEKMAQPTAYGWSWNQYNNQLAYEEFVKELNASLEKSSAANLDYNVKLNQLLPTAVRQGLEAAGINPLLAVLGNWSTQTGSVSSAHTGVGSPGVPHLQGSGNRGAGAGLLSKFFDLVSGSTFAQNANVRQDTKVKEAGVKDVEAGAALKQAEAAFTIARAETENAVRDSLVKDKRLTADYGQGVTGSAARIVSTVKDYLTGLHDSAINSAEARADSRFSAVPSPSSAKASADEFNGDSERARRQENRRRALQRANDDYEKERRRNNAKRIYMRNLGFNFD